MVALDGEFRGRERARRAVPLVEAVGEGAAGEAGDRHLIRERPAGRTGAEGGSGGGPVSVIVLLKVGENEVVTSLCVHRRRHEQQRQKSGEQGSGAHVGLSRVPESSADDVPGRIQGFAPAPPPPDDARTTSGAWSTMCRGGSVGSRSRWSM